MDAAEVAVHRMLSGHRVRKRRELFRVDAATARQVVEAVATSLPASRSPLAFLTRLLPVSARPLRTAPAATHAAPVSGAPGAAASRCRSAWRPASWRSAPWPCC